ncbi:hypothetical protein DPV73_10785 [Leptospira mayottensis]|nr:hypothetical protein DPV73_10785 [Leptospira mayottensis]
MFYRIQVEICFESVFLLELILLNDLVYKTRNSLEIGLGRTESTFFWLSRFWKNGEAFAKSENT